MTVATDDEFNAILESLMLGAVDMHVHFAPDPRPDHPNLARRMDALETLRSADAAGMGAIVLKSHFWPTAGLAQVIQPMVQTTKVFGMVVINYQDGDRPNPFAVEVGARLGAKIVMAPSAHAVSTVQRARRAGKDVFGVREDQDGLPIVGPDGMLVPEMEQILDIAQQFDLAVASGHVRTPEDRALVLGAHRRGLTTIMTHIRPDPTLLDERKWMVAHGAIIEWCGDLLPPRPADVPLTIEHIRAVGVQNSCVTTDSGQASKPPVAECLRMFVAQLLLGGMTPEEVYTIIQAVPSRVLALKPA